MADDVSILEPGAAPAGHALTKSAAKEIGGKKYQRLVQTIEKGGAQVDVGLDNPAPVHLRTPAGAALNPATAEGLDALATILIAIGTKLIASPATEMAQAAGNTALAAIDTKLAAQIGHLDGVEGGLASILAKLIAAPATEAKQTALVDQGAEALAGMAANATAVSSLLAVLASPLVVDRRQAAPTVTRSQATQAAAAAGIQLFIGNADRTGGSIYNWTASPVYIAPGTTDAPAQGGGSLYVPPAIGSEPGYFEFNFRPTVAMRASSAAAIDLTVELH